MKLRTLSLISTLLVSAGTMAPAHAAVIDFEVDANGCYSTNCPNVQGFDFAFEASGWGVSDDNNSYFNRGASGNGIAGARGARNGVTTITMTQSGGGSFSISALEAATGLTSFVGASSIDLVGLLAGGGTVTQSLGVTSSWASFLLNGFNNLTQLTFSASNTQAGLTLDNINTGAANNVPAPATLALLGLGLAGLAGARRKHD